eukprot:gnl/MRDRNA2_/MRDRNA2_27788_c0_seq1.p1 gnl/MRDRNA2_/MRDRNA2_27788_c0~~gnl/MRDRNA2_/MRDRNA2_27788_c0_seq1.p1  ORF type:complete len:1015 (-),score=120.16 gnl/MRDRNA2_/MRDRNA2_27788_c0_seq1:80-3124(-)
MPLKLELDLKPDLHRPEYIRPLQTPRNDRQQHDIPARQHERPVHSPRHDQQSNDHSRSLSPEELRRRAKQARRVQYAKMASATHINSKHGRHESHDRHESHERPESRGEDDDRSEHYTESRRTSRNHRKSHRRTHFMAAEDAHMATLKTGASLKIEDYNRAAESLMTDYTHTSLLVPLHSIRGIARLLDTGESIGLGNDTIADALRSLNSYSNQSLQSKTEELQIKPWQSPLQSPRFNARPNQITDPCALSQPADIMQEPSAQERVPRHDLRHDIRRVGANPMSEPGQPQPRPIPWVWSIRSSNDPSSATDDLLKMRNKIHMPRARSESPSQRQIKSQPAALRGSSAEPLERNSNVDSPVTLVRNNSAQFEERKNRRQTMDFTGDPNRLAPEHKMMRQNSAGTIRQHITGSTEDLHNVRPHNSASLSEAYHTRKSICKAAGLPSKDRTQEDTKRASTVNHGRGSNAHSVAGEANGHFNCLTPEERAKARVISYRMNKKNQKDSADLTVARSPQSPRKSLQPEAPQSPRLARKSAQLEASQSPRLSEVALTAEEKAKASKATKKMTSAFRKNHPSSLGTGLNKKQLLVDQGPTRSPRVSPRVSPAGSCQSLHSLNQDDKEIIKKPDKERAEKEVAASMVQPQENGELVFSTAERMEGLKSAVAVSPVIQVTPPKPEQLRAPELLNSIAKNVGSEQAQQRSPSNNASSEHIPQRSPSKNASSEHTLQRSPSKNASSEHAPQRSPSKNASSEHTQQRSPSKNASNDYTHQRSPSSADQRKTLTSQLGVSRKGSKMVTSPRSSASVAPSSIQVHTPRDPVASVDVSDMAGSSRLQAFQDQPDCHSSTYMQKLRFSNQISVDKEAKANSKLASSSSSEDIRNQRPAAKRMSVIEPDRRFMDRAVERMRQGRNSVVTRGTFGNARTSLTWLNSSGDTAPAQCRGDIDTFKVKPPISSQTRSDEAKTPPVNRKPVKEPQVNAEPPKLSLGAHVTDSKATSGGDRPSAKAFFKKVQNNSQKR